MNWNSRPKIERLNVNQTSLAILESDWRDLRAFRALSNALALFAVVPGVGWRRLTSSENVLQKSPSKELISWLELISNHAILARFSFSLLWDICIHIWLAIIKSANYKRSRKTLNRLLIKKLNRRGSNTFFEQRRKTANIWRAVEEPLKRICDKQTSFICRRVDSNNAQSITSFC